jgi:predicted ATP-dependent endonuclease of OLD family
VKWKQDGEKSVKIEEPVAGIQIGERGFEGELSRFGHGLQRSYMLALLQELNTIDDTAAPTLILCIEEPELYQHPPQARYLSETLQDLADDNTQVMVCSHSPTFIPKNDFEKVRMVTEFGNPVETKNTRVTYQQLSDYLISIGGKAINKAGIVAKLFPYLSPSINEMFFCKVPIFVEGIEDVAYIKTYAELNGQTTGLRSLGCHLIHADKKSNIIEPLAVAKLLQLNSFVVFDSDTDAKEVHQPDHKRDNKKILTIQGHGAESEWPETNIEKENLWAWKTNLCDSVKAEIANWDTYCNQSNGEYGNAGGLQKNPLAIARTLELAWQAGEKSQVLIKLVTDILKFAEQVQK